MTAEEILNRLRELLPELRVTELRLAHTIKPCITICCTVEHIIRTYDSTPENESEVETLLVKLMNLHFSAPI